MSRVNLHTLNVLKFRTLCSILFWSKFCFLCSCFLKYLVEWQTVSALFAYIILSVTLVFEILGHLLYFAKWSTFFLLDADHIVFLDDSQTVQNLIRCRVLWHLIWGYTVWLCLPVQILGINTVIYIFCTFSLLMAHIFFPSNTSLFVLIKLHHIKFKNKPEILFCANRSVIKILIFSISKSIISV